MFRSNSQIIWILFLALILSGSSVWAQTGGPVTVVEGYLHSVNPSHNAYEHYGDPTARGMLALKNESSDSLKGIQVEAQFFHPEGRLLFTDVQTLDLKAKKNADVFFVWPNPSRAQIDHVKVLISGKSGGKDFRFEHVLRYPNPQSP
mgnify:CR=1 FL=1